MRREAWGHGHVEVLSQFALEKCLLHIDGGQVIVAGSCDGKDDANGGDFHDCREDPVKINSLALRVAVSDQTTLELFDSAIREPLHGEDHVTTHNVDILGQLIKEDVVPRATLDQAVELFCDRCLPVLGPPTLERVAVAPWDRHVADVSRHGCLHRLVRAETTNRTLVSKRWRSLVRPREIIEELVVVDGMFLVRSCWIREVVAGVRPALEGRNIVWCCRLALTFDGMRAEIALKVSAAAVVYGGTQPVTAAHGRDVVRLVDSR